MERLLASACLLGFECKYSGGSNALPDEELAALRRKYLLVPVCPETAGGLPTPREPSERRGGKIVSREGKDVTANFAIGADVALRLCRRFGCRKALLKERSPSCGSGEIYDGSFSGVLTEGDGAAAEAIKAAGVEIFGESRIKELL